MAVRPPVMASRVPTAHVFLGGSRRHVSPSDVTLLQDPQGEAPGTMSPPRLPRLEVPEWTFDFLTFGMLDRQDVVDDYVRSLIDDYMRASEGVYTVYFVAGDPPVQHVDEVSVMPFFRRGRGWAPNPGTPEQMAERIQEATGRHGRDFYSTARMCAYGRGSPEDLAMVTQALIDEGKLAEVLQKYEYPHMSEADFKATHGDVSNNPLSLENQIKLLQWEYGLGIDCAGYVQQAFLAVHGGTRKRWGFDSVGNESLYDLAGNRAFSHPSPDQVRPGDLMILDPPEDETAGHTVLIRDRTEVTDAERQQLPGIEAFAAPTDTVHRIEVDASWGAGFGNLDSGGVQRRTFLYNETTGEWADVNARTREVTQDAGKEGPYGGHPVEGIYHPKR